jgi:hypothetical protein
LEEIVAAPVWKTENTAIAIHHADHVTPSIRKELALISQTSGGRSVGVSRWRIQVTEFSFWFCFVAYMGTLLEWRWFLMRGMH